MVPSTKFGSLDTIKPEYFPNYSLIARKCSDTTLACSESLSLNAPPPELSFWKTSLTAIRLKLPQDFSIPNRKKKIFPSPLKSMSSWEIKSPKLSGIIWNSFMTKSKPDSKENKKSHNSKCSNPPESKVKNKIKDKQETKLSSRPEKSKTLLWPQKKAKQMMTPKRNPSVTCLRRPDKWLKR